MHTLTIAQYLAIVACVAVVAALPSPPPELIPRYRPLPIIVRGCGPGLQAWSVCGAGNYCCGLGLFGEPHCYTFESACYHLSYRDRTECHDVAGQELKPEGCVPPPPPTPELPGKPGQ